MGPPSIDLSRRTQRERLLLAVEPAPGAAAIINAAARHAHRMQAEVLVLSVRERAYSRGVVWDVRPAGELAEVVSHAIYELQRVGVAARGLIGRARLGHVADEIVYAAVKYAVDEIVIGGSGRSIIGSLLATSVGPRVLRLSPVPVLTIPTGRNARLPSMRRPSRSYQSAA